MNNMNFQDIRRKSWFKNLMFLLVIGFIYFSGFPLWLNVQISSLQLGFSEEGAMKSYGETVYRTPILLNDVNGHTIDLSSFEGRPLFLNFWASWCVPCLAEFPSLVRASDSLPEIEFVFVNRESVEAFEEFLSKTKHDLPFYNTKSMVPPELNHKSIPATYLINREGVVVYRSFGAYDWSSSEALEFLRQLI